MLSCTEDPTAVGVRDAAMLAILMVGLRRSEVVNLNLKDFNRPTSTTRHK
jgi:site-specific recombinase XerD